MTCVCGVWICMTVVCVVCSVMACCVLYVVCVCRTVVFVVCDVYYCVVIGVYCGVWDVACSLGCMLCGMCVCVNGTVGSIV